MSEPAHIRAFVAVDLVPQVRLGLVQLKAELARTRADVRWVRDDGLHATLKFLGAVAAERLEAVGEAVAQVAAAVPEFAAHVRGLGAFPSLKRPRVCWVGIEAAQLAVLARAVENALVPLGFAAEARPFHAHVTLGRINSPRGWPALEEMLKQHWNDDFGVSPVDCITVYRSDLRAGGAVYTALWTRRLAASTRGADHGIG
ncbi:MAG: RNA 2',3'-cyclic phosphodiesterase [Deltaproteobacteria bacterium]|nr:RNA 2',3'-cyclic phosphodiesterase [Deltaproteobacteria bacterium]